MKIRQVWWGQGRGGKSVSGSDGKRRGGDRVFGNAGMETGDAQVGG